MAKRDCAAGSKWDNLLNTCIRVGTTPGPTELPQDVVVPLGETPSVVVLSPALWIFMVLTTLGSILALLLWLIIYRRQTRLQSSTPDNKEPGQEPLQKPELFPKAHPPPAERNGPPETVQGSVAGPSPWPQLHPGAQTGSAWGQGFVAGRGPAEYSEEGEGRAACRVPLPATELGGTALVTTKTV